MIVRNGKALGSVLHSIAPKAAANQKLPAAELTETEEEADRQAAQARVAVEPSRAEPQRPPTSGPGSGAGAWRRYAAGVTESPVESWAALTRDEIIELLDSEGVSDGDDRPHD